MLLEGSMQECAKTLSALLIPTRAVPFHRSIVSAAVRGAYASTTMGPIMGDLSGQGCEPGYDLLGRFFLSTAESTANSGNLLGLG